VTTADEIERQIVARWLYARRCRLFVLLRRRLEAIAYAPGWEAKA
jgi:hypothetical protein